MPSKKSEMQAEAVRLRVQERRSIGEIQELTGASKGSLSAWLRPYPLTPEELDVRKHSWVRWRPPRKDRGQVSKHWMAVPAPNQISMARISEAAVLFRLALHGLEVFGSMFEGHKADWVVLVPDTGKVWKIQVKSVVKPQQDPEHGGLPLVPLRCGHGKRRYRADEIDFLVGYDLRTDTAYVWRLDELDHIKTTVTVTPEAAERWDKLK